MYLSDLYSPLINLQEARLGELKARRGYKSRLLITRSKKTRALSRAIRLSHVSLSQQLALD